MYQLYNTYNETYQIIYGVRTNDQGETLFLIFDDGVWKWMFDYWFKPSHF